MFAATESYRVLILKADKLCAGTLRQTLQQFLPVALIRVEPTIKQALRALAEEPVDLLIAGVGFPDGDVLDLLAESSAAPRRFQRTFVVTGRRDQRLLNALKALPIQGVFDPMSEELAQLVIAISIVMAGGCYWSASVLEHLSRSGILHGSLSCLLSPTEQLVFAVIGDGCDDEEAAGKLSLRPSTIHSVRREIHRKLGAQHKGELVRMAVQHGYVRFTADGVHRPGFSGLLAACRKRRTEPES